MKIKRKHIVAVAAAVIAIALLWNGITLLLENTSIETHTAKVVWKERTSQGHIWQLHKYLVYTIDENDTVRVFEITDSVRFNRYNGSDYYARVNIGETYTFMLVGHRIPYLAMYKNIIKMDEHGVITESDKKE